MAKLSELKSKQLQTTDDGEGGDEGETKEGWLRWVIGWVVGPGLFVALLVGLGAHVGANYPDAWFPRLVTWLFG